MYATPPALFSAPNCFDRDYDRGAFEHDINLATGFSGAIVFFPDKDQLNDVVMKEWRLGHDSFSTVRRSVGGIRQVSSLL